MHVHGRLAKLSRIYKGMAGNPWGSNVHDEHCTLSLYHEKKKGRKKKKEKKR